MNAHATVTAQRVEPVDVYVGDRIRLARKTQAISQTSLAAAIGLTFQQVQKYERGYNRVSASRLHAIAAHLGLPVAWFFEGVELPITRADPDIALKAAMRDDDIRQIVMAAAKLNPKARALLRVAVLAIAAEC